MISHKVFFDKFSEITLEKLLDYPIGTYIIWDGKAKKRPTYIGEGNILSRFNGHRKRFAFPLDGYIALLANDEKKAKINAEILEALLLFIADVTNRYPNANKADGKWKGLNNVFDDHGVFKISLYGYDPFSHPKKSRYVENPRIIRVTIILDDDGNDAFDVQHEWRHLP